MTARQYLRRHWLAVALLAAGAMILGAAVLLLRTMPPRTITMATGSEGGTYHEVGKFYRAILAQSGVELRLVATDVEFVLGSGPEVRGPGEALLMAGVGRAQALSDLDGDGLEELRSRIA